jgi:hypothetical protein
MFTAHSRARTMNIHYQLSALKKGDSSIADYFLKFTGLVDTLAAIDQPLKQEEQSLFFLQVSAPNMNPLSPQSK